MTDILIAPSACNIQVAKTTNFTIIGVVSIQLNSGRLLSVWEHFLHVACMMMCLCLSTEWWLEMWSTFSNISHLVSVCVHVCVCSPGGERESGRNSWRSVSKFTTVRMQMEFPADYTEVKQAGPDKEKNKPYTTSHKSATLMKQKFKLNKKDEWSNIQFRQLESLLPFSFSCRPDVSCFSVK